MPIAFFKQIFFALMDCTTWNEIQA